MAEKAYMILAFYYLNPLADPHAEVALHKSFFASRDITSRVYISEQGINGQMCAIRKDAEEYMDWMHSREGFGSIIFKIHTYHEHVFPRKTVKYRKQLVAIDAEVDLGVRGQHTDPQQWRELLEQPDQKILLDVRNDYEWKVGHFEGAELPPCETFRDFNRYAEELHKKVDPKKTPVMMYCTGGIRCELYSSILINHGFEKVYQLDGGIINYGLKEGNAHWLGKLFVFDDRLAIPISEENPSIVGKCHHCQKENDDYYNCASMDCNTLFLCCKECLQSYLGCCQESCKNSPRLRPYHQQNPHKPFRKRHHYEQHKRNALKRKNAIDVPLEACENC